MNHISSVLQAFRRGRQQKTGAEQQKTIRREQKTNAAQQSAGRRQQVTGFLVADYVKGAAINFHQSL
jgi:hypothetical protein